MSLRHYLVSGRVQGVGFRRFVENQAREYGVRGVVRNLEDGRVEFIAAGELGAVKKLEEAVRRGPMLSHVREIQSRTITAEALPEPLKSGIQEGTMWVAEDGESPWAIS